MAILKSFRSAALLPLVLAAGAAGAQERQSLAPVIARITPSVVLVESWRKPPTTALDSDPAFQRFFGLDRETEEDDDRPRERSESATAFVVDAGAGLLVTTDYVLRDVSRVQVRLAGGEIRPATVIGLDEATGVGLLRVAPEGLSVLAWSDAEPAIGDPVLLVAHVFGKGPIATTGIVSGREQAVDSFEGTSLFLDVAVNKGAAGGVVASPDGRVIGMAYGMFGAGYEPYASLGVAVPASEMRPIIDALARDGRIRRGWIGVSVSALPLQRGVEVRTVEDDSPAARAGLKPDDFIFAVDGAAIADDRTLRRIVARAPIGSSLRLSVRASDGNEREVTVVTEATPDPP